MKFPDIALSTLAALRLSRFVSTDSLGDWWITAPAKKWATEREGGIMLGYGVNGSDIAATSEKVAQEHRETLERAEPDPQFGWRSKLVSGLECGFCGGFWLGAGVVGSYYVARQNPRTLKLWRVGAGILGMNYVTGHISSRLD